MRSTAVLTVAALFALSASAGAARGGDPIYKPGARYRSYSRAWSEAHDVDTLKPAATGVINVGKGRSNIKPPSRGDSFVVVEGFIRLNRAGRYRFKPGYGNSTFNAMTVGGKEVHRKNTGDAEPALTEIRIKGYWTEREHARQWDTEVLSKDPVRPNGEIYDEKACAFIKKTVQDIIGMCFPRGRPRR